MVVTVIAVSSSSFAWDYFFASPSHLGESIHVSMDNFSHVAPLLCRVVRSAIIILPIDECPVNGVATANKSTGADDDDKNYPAVIAGVRHC